MQSKIKRLKIYSEAKKILWNIIYCFNIHIYCELCASPILLCYILQCIYLISFVLYSYLEKEEEEK